MFFGLEALCPRRPLSRRSAAASVEDETADKETFFGSTVLIYPSALSKDSRQHSKDSILNPKTRNLILGAQTLDPKIPVFRKLHDFPFCARP